MLNSEGGHVSIDTDRMLNMQCIMAHQEGSTSCSIYGNAMEMF